MTLLQALETSVPFLLFSSLLLGLIVGSFLNVVILRLPAMMQHAWKAECRTLLADEPLSPADSDTSDPPVTLVRPRSACPQCGRFIRAIENIPVISYIALRGRCAGCGNRISIQYPAVELLTGVLTLWAAWHFGVTAQALAAMVMTWALIALTAIDLRTQLLPDSITLPLLWLGLLLNSQSVFVSLHDSVIGAAAGYLSLWTIYHLFRLATGKEGMGFGDFKLFAAFGAWFGWQSLPLIIFLSSIVGAVVGLIVLGVLRKGTDTPLPFGPYLAGAGWIAMYWGDAITRGYLTATGIA